MKDRAKIMKAATGEFKKMFKIRPAKKYIRLYSELIKVFSTARNQGRCVDFNWLWSKAHKIKREVLKEDRIIRKHILSRDAILNFDKPRFKGMARYHSGKTSWHR